MGLFGKKKPWDYSSKRDKIMSIINDYSDDKKVLRKTIQKESDPEVRGLALINDLPFEGHVSLEPSSMLKFLTQELNVSPGDATDIVAWVLAKLKMAKDSGALD